LSPELVKSTPTGSPGGCESVLGESGCCAAFSWAREKEGAHISTPLIANSSTPRKRKLPFLTIAGLSAPVFTSFLERV
jgi:hypothetical protein